MRTRINLLGFVLVLGALIALFKGVTAMVSVGACLGEPCSNAGDIVFFTTTIFNDVTPCSSPTANLYAFTYVGGAAYDNTGDNAVTNKDTPLVKSIAGQRATAPFIVDQHLAFSVGGKVEMFGDGSAYNNGIGQAGVRILSWREIR